jgi:hypothetical protein
MYCASSVSHSLLMSIQRQHCQKVTSFEPDCGLLLLEPDHVCAQTRSTIAGQSKVFRDILLRRSFSSTISGKRVGDSLPCRQRINIDCEYTPEERVLYDKMYADKSYKLFRKKDNLNNTGVAWSTSFR